MTQHNCTTEYIHSEDLQEIISKPPSWLLQRGISTVFMIIVSIIGLSFFISYPESVHTNMRFTTTNSPKIIVSQGNGVLTKLLVSDGADLVGGQTVAYVESTADHDQVINLLKNLKELRLRNLSVDDLQNIIPPDYLDLGELQSSYQSFYLSFLNYQAVSKGGIFEKRKQALRNEVNYVNEQNDRIREAFRLQQLELDLAEAEFEKFKQLAEKKIISPLELHQKEAIILAKRQAIPQMESNIITNKSNLLSKSREISEVDNQIIEEERKFVQSLNSFISEAEIWKKVHVLSAPIAGKLVYAAFWQENQHIEVGEELFYVNPGKEDYYGESYISPIYISKVALGQEVLIKVKSYPHLEFGYIHGKVEYVSDIPVKDSMFFSKISLVRDSTDSLIKLKHGMTAEAEIITEDQSIFYRIWKNLTKNLSI